MVGTGIIQEHSTGLGSDMTTKDGIYYAITFG